VTYRSFVPLLAVVALTGNLCAQESTEDEDPIEGKASLGYLATSGNTESTNANAAFNLIWNKALWSHEFNLSAVAADTSGVTTAEAYTAGYTARRDLSEQGYLFTALDWQHDRFSGYDEQVSETAGYGRRLIATDRHELNAEVGIGARQATLRDGFKDDDAIVRGAIDYAWSISDTSEFTQDLVIESGSSNTSVQTRTELRARIVGNVAVVLSYRIKNNSDVVPGTEKTDRFTAISLEYAF
jgi:putative salt-induced outer membrane protein